jgi:hypothetical protein
MLPRDAEPLPCIAIGPYRVSRLIVGGNPFSGNSHQSGERDREMRDFYTTARIKQVLSDCERRGVNTVLARGDRHIERVLCEYRLEGGRLMWIAQTASERASLGANLDEIRGFGAEMCYLHGSWVDRMVSEGRLRELPAALEAIRERGMVAGLATHNPRVPAMAEAAGFPVEFYCVSLYDLPRRGEVYLEEDRAAALGAIRSIDKPAIAYKVLAAGRNEPEEALRVAFGGIRAKDGVCVGVFPKDRPDEVEQLAALTRRYGAGTG